jgi:hypothetical protein
MHEEFGRPAQSQIFEMRMATGRLGSTDRDRATLCIDHASEPNFIVKSKQGIPTRVKDKDRYGE